MEGYSKEAFENNEKNIDKVRDLARHRPFSGRGDPVDILSARWNYIAGKEKRKKLLDQSHDEAIKENTDRSESKSAKLVDFQKLIIETESGNRYIIQKGESGEKYMIANFNTGDIMEVPSVELENTLITRGKSVSFGAFGNTSAVKSAKGFR